MTYIEYSREDAIGTITLNRPEKANAQSPALLDELHQTFMTAAADNEVKVIVLQAEGKHFSAGHDLQLPPDEIPEWKDGLSNWYDFEATKFLGYCRAWRDIPKPTIAAVQGACIAAGLMLAWPCDLIVASESAYFGDSVGRLGVGAGVEYHGHTWEFGPRKAKELLFTGGFIDAREAERLGMVNKVVPDAELRQATRELALRIAEMDAFSLRMSKRAVNSTMDIQGFSNSLNAVFDQHWLGHANVFALRGHPDTVAPEGLVSFDGLTAANRAQPHPPNGRE